jgi:hypothetical protein
MWRTPIVALAPEAGGGGFYKYLVWRISWWLGYSDTRTLRTSESYLYALVHLLLLYVRTRYSVAYSWLCCGILFPVIRINIT